MVGVRRVDPGVTLASWSNNTDADRNAGSDLRAVQPFGARQLPGGSSVLVLLWKLGVHAALSPLLRTSLCRTDAYRDAHADRAGVLHSAALSARRSLFLPR